MARPTLDFIELVLADDTEDTIFHELTAGRILTHVTIGYETGSVSSSIFAFAALMVGSIEMKLVGGWIWYPPVSEHADDPVWDGRIEIPPNARIRFQGTNLTGLTKTIRCSFSTERS